MASSMCSINVKTTGPLPLTSTFSSRRQVCCKSRMSGEGFDGEVHVLFDLGGILQRVRARHPHAFVQRDADAVRELLQRHGAVFVVVVFRERLGDVRGGVSGLQLARCPAYMESYTSRYRSISFWVIFMPCAPPHLKQRTKSMK